MKLYNIRDRIIIYSVCDVYQLNTLRMENRIIGNFLPDQIRIDVMSSVPEELMGTWTGQKISEEPPELESTFTLFADGHYEYNNVSTEEEGPVGAPSYGIQSHQQQVKGTVIINGPFMILHPTSNSIDGQKMQTDNAVDARYVWQIFNTQEDGVVGLKLVGSDNARFFYRNFDEYKAV